MAKSIWTVADLMQELRKCPEHAVVQFADYKVVEAMESGNCKEMPAITVQRVIQREMTSTPSMERRQGVIIATTGLITFLDDGFDKK
jgi:hypothetical protein